MAQTENLKIRKLDSSDYVSVDGINDAFDKLDALGADYVVESGNDNGWWYMKFASGRAFCGRDNVSFGKDAMTAWGSMYSGATHSFGPYPASVKFTSAPNVTINNLTTSWLWPCPTANQSSTTQSPSFAMVSGASYTVADLRCGIFVSGRWK